ncbi:MAG TPA: radical SAM protein [Patescibacteria group bacterium]|nr:radical SAM protein [Patescibacteria group bacterium]
MKKISTLSVVTGTNSCNAKCPFCIARMTPQQSAMNNINYRNLDIACRLAEKAGAVTALITGKGEPTLYPDTISFYLTNLSKYFPILELQTNGLILPDDKYNKFLKSWYGLGLTTISLSIVHYNDSRNKEIYTGNRDYINLQLLINKLHNYGFSVRLSVIALKNYIDSPMEIARMIKFAKDNKVAQLTIRPMVVYEATANKKVLNWALSHTIGPNWEDIVAKTLSKIKNTFLMNLTHGGKVYDVSGQNVCFNTCLTLNPNEDELRQLIYFPDGKITYDWRYKGARII